MINLNIQEVAINTTSNLLKDYQSFFGVILSCIISLVVCGATNYQNKKHWESDIFHKEFCKNIIEFENRAYKFTDTNSYYFSNYITSESIDIIKSQSKVLGQSCFELLCQIDKLGTKYKIVEPKQFKSLSSFITLYMLELNNICNKYENLTDIKSSIEKMELYLEAFIDSPLHSNEKENLEYLKNIDSVPELKNVTNIEIIFTFDQIIKKIGRNITSLIQYK